MRHIEINKFIDINYLEILDDYQQNFAGKKICIYTNYKVLDKFLVSFDILNLPHLMGWQKIMDKGAYSSNIIKMIKNTDLTLSNSRRHSNFFKIKDRLLNYTFLYDIFYSESDNICVMTSNMKPNKLKLDIVFYKEKDPKHIVVLGLRKNKESTYFVPTTLHVELTKNNPYLYRRKTKIERLEWIE